MQKRDTSKADVIEYMQTDPLSIAHALGFKDLTKMHNEWMIAMIEGEEDETLQAHRGSFKTTCVSVALSIIIILYPKQRCLFMRKTDGDTKEVIRQVAKILQSEIMQTLCFLLWGKCLVLTTATQTEISTNLTNDIKGTSQLLGIGLGGSITGKHYDRIFTDDIVNVNDRISRAEREKTKLVYQELQNIKNRGGRIFNTGTPWHKDDCFALMPNIQKFDVETTGLITAEQQETLKQSMTRSLYAANYELRHIAEEDVIFDTPVTDYDPSAVEQGEGHIDASYGGEDYTAFTICRKGRLQIGTNEIDGSPIYDERLKYFVYGRLWNKHIDDVEGEIINLRKAFMAGKISCENNGDKGYLAKDLRAKGERVSVYHEDMNKYLKITSYLKSVWRDVIFVKGTDEEYINQICDYNENAEHDDAPDSLASIVRKLWNKKDSEEYKPIFM